MKKKIILISLIFVIFITALTGSVNAANVGKIEFIAINNSNSKPVENLEISIYQVKVKNDNGNFEFAQGFEQCKIALDNLSESNLSNLADFAKANAEPILKETTNSNGEFILAELELGMYLLVQENKTESVTMQTMLITIPELTVENGLKYEITAKPKIVDKVNEEIPSEEPIEDETLPATGTLDWLVPVLAVAAIVIFCLAWLKVYSNSKKKVK